MLTLTRPTDPDETVLTTQGRPLSPDDEIRVVDPDDKDVPDGESGELLARGPRTAHRGRLPGGDRPPGGPLVRPVTDGASVGGCTDADTDADADGP
ncbi:AMP-binding protein [Streptomyces sp. NPDC058682]|uniref:AMP-binding protein n=1 Tax=Streptomyces sp. NPDC058682 TaxID=3346596 RepID=UPI00364834C5